MAILSLAVANFRCLREISLDFDPRCTAIAGVNGAGKTSLLEAVHVLSSGKSFRTSRPELLLGRSGSSEFLVTGRVIQRGLHHSLGVRWRDGAKEVHLDGAPCRGFAQLSAAMPVQVIDPNSHTLIEGGPSERRRFVDWGVFHVEQSFATLWRHFNTALRQRNAALKAQQPMPLVRSWDEQLVKSGQAVGKCRREYLEALGRVVGSLVEELLGSSVSLHMRDGWPEGETLEKCLEASWSRDLRFRTTTVGPHRADLEIRIANTPAKDVVSRGQQKLLACALILAQLQHRTDKGFDPATLLLDDPAAELDVNNLGKLLRVICRIPAQLIATAVDLHTVDILAPAKMFHVEQGVASQML